jgi:hypothetical protein
MKKKIILITILIIFSFLILNEFILFPFGINTVRSQADCIKPSLFSTEEFPYGLVDNSDIILIGTAKNSKGITNNRGVNTHTEILIHEIIKGSYEDERITVLSDGGCNMRLNYCVDTSITVHPKRNNKYVLFLSHLGEDIYGGFSSCGGIYLIENNQINCGMIELDGCENNKINLDNLKEQINQK